MQTILQRYRCRYIDYDYLCKHVPIEVMLLMMEATPSPVFDAVWLEYCYNLRSDKKNG